MPEDIPTKYCGRIGKNVYADSMDDSGRFLVFCKYYDSGSCIKPTKDKRCLVKLSIQREEIKGLSSQVLS